MAALDSHNIPGKEALKFAFWSWFEANQEDEIYILKAWIFKKTFHLRDLQFVFERFFGPRVQVN